MIDNERVAIILVEATYYGDAPTAKKFAIHRNTLTNYRKRLNENDELMQIYAIKKAIFEQNWGNGVPAAIVAALDFIKRASQEADPTNPDAIHAVAGALKLVAEIGLTKEVIDARLAEYHRGERTEGYEMVASLPNRTD